MWDGYYYFSLLKSAINNTSTLSDFISTFNLNSHPSMGYASYASIGQLFYFDNQIILHIQNILLSLLAAYSLFYILIYFIGESNKLLVALITAAFLFHPLKNAVLLNFNLDYPILVFLTTLVCSHIYNKNTYVVLSGIMLVFTKETGIILYCSFLIALGVPFLVSKVTKLKVPRSKIGLSYALPIFFLGLYFVVRYTMDLSLLFSAGYESWQSILKEIIEPDLKVLWARFLQIFVLNFNWLITILAILFLKKLISDKSPFTYISAYKTTNLIVILALFIAFLFMSMLLFKMAVNPRYMIASLFFMPIIFAISLTQLVKNKLIRSSLAVIYLVMVILQNNKSIDPVSNFLFSTYKFGKHNIVKTDALMDSSYRHGPRASMVYNLQYTVMDQLIYKFYNKIHVDESTVLITERADHPTLHPKFRNSNIQPNVIILDELDMHMPSFDTNANCYYVHIPHQNNDPEVGKEYIKTKFSIVNTEIVELDGYEIYIYELKKY